MIAPAVGSPNKVAPVPFLDLRAHHEPFMDEFVDAFRKVAETSAFAGGPFVAAFEKEFASFCGTKHCVAVGNGTDALWLSLLALGIGPGDEVITVPNSFMATAEAISYCGANPCSWTSTSRPARWTPASLRRPSRCARARSFPFIFTARWRTWKRFWPWPSATDCPSLKTPARRTVPGAVAALPAALA